MNGKTSIATSSAAGQRTMFHTSAAVGAEADEPEQVLGEVSAGEHEDPGHEHEHERAEHDRGRHIDQLAPQNPRPLSISNTTLSARRAASSTPVVPYGATATLIATAVAAVPLLRSARWSELSSGAMTEAGATSRA
jgi:hypothetical protein